MIVTFSNIVIMSSFINSNNCRLNVNTERIPTVLKFLFN